MNGRFFRSALAITASIKEGLEKATDIVDQHLAAISQHNATLNAYSTVLSERARSRAERIDAAVARGDDPGPLAGVPFAVKNLYDIKSIVTLAGSKINADHPPATRDAVLIERLEHNGAILLGALAMGEFAYDFTGENAHYGNCANPWDTQCMSGGSSSGCGSATAGGLAPISLGSDTNGSIRVPASFCGIFGLKPTYGRLPRTGSFPFCDSLDHLGPLARTVDDLAMVFDLLQGYDSRDHACSPVAHLKTRASLDAGIADLNIGRATGYFCCDTFPQAREAVDKVCDSLGVRKEQELPGALEGRSAAYLITNAEGSALHLDDLRQSAANFDPDTRYRFLAGACLPAEWYLRAQAARHQFYQQAMTVFEDLDVLVAPATPITAPKIGTRKLRINGEEQLLRPNLGYFTQPISAIGLPSVVVPTFDSDTGMPIGVQIVAAPWREDHCLRVAKVLENHGFRCAEPPL